MIPSYQPQVYEARPPLAAYPAGPDDDWLVYADPALESGAWIAMKADDCVEIRQ